MRSVLLVLALVVLVSLPAYAQSPTVRSLAESVHVLTGRVDSLSGDLQALTVRVDRLERLFWPVTCTECIDLVAVQLVASPDPAAAGGSTIFRYVLINFGDQPTSLTATQPLTFFDVAGSGPATFAAVTSSDPSITCTSLQSGANFVLNDCFGNLGPGQSVTLTITASSLTAGSIIAAGTADPTLVVPEFLNNNNSITNSVVVQ